MQTKNIALAGAALLVVGAFAPMVSLPIVGSVTPMQDGRSLGWIWLAFGGLGAYYAARGDGERVLRVGGGAMAVAVAWLLYMLVKLSDARAEVGKMDSVLLKGFADAALGAINFEWGWAALFVGAGMLIYAGGPAEKTFLCPKCKSQVFDGDEDCVACGSYLRWVGEKVFLRPRPAGALVVPPSPQGRPAGGGE